MGFTPEPLIQPPSPTLEPLPVKQLRFSEEGRQHDDSDDEEHDNALAGGFPDAEKVSAVAAVSSSSSGAEPLQVFLRVRPLQVEREGDESTLNVVDASSVYCKAPQGAKTHRGTDHSSGKFEFTQVFGPETTQAGVFDVVARPLVESAASTSGYSGLMFAYGMTGSGKSHTISGKVEDPEQRGLLPRTLSLLYEKLQAAGKLNSSPGGVTVLVSFLELFGDSITDLLNGHTGLKIGENKGRPHVKSITRAICNSAAEAQRAMKRGLTARRKAPTALNDQSSRSHIAFVITVVANPQGSSKVPSDASEVFDANYRLLNGYSHYSSLTVVDLAGSERSDRTQGDKDRVAEAGNINKSLTVLKRCFEALRMGKIAPVRDHNLTHLLMDHFSGAGAGHIAMIVNVGPGAGDYDETWRVLQFGARSKEIQTTSSRNLLAGGASTTSNAGYNIHGQRVRAGSTATEATAGAGLSRHGSSRSMTTTSTAASGASSLHARGGAMAKGGSYAKHGPKHASAGVGTAGGKGGAVGTSRGKAASSAAASAAAAQPAPSDTEDDGDDLGIDEADGGSVVMPCAGGDLEAESGLEEGDDVDMGGAAGARAASDDDESMGPSSFRGGPQRGGRVDSDAGEECDDEDEDDDDDDGDALAPMSRALPIASYGAYHPSSSAAAAAAGSSASVAPSESSNDTEARIRAELTSKFQAELDAYCSQVAAQLQEQYADHVTTLQRELMVAEERAEDAEERAAGIEAEVRAEVSEEMTRALAEQEEAHKAKARAGEARLAERLAKEARLRALRGEEDDEEDGGTGVDDDEEGVVGALPRMGAGGRLTIGGGARASSATGRGGFRARMRSSAMMSTAGSESAGTGADASSGSRGRSSLFVPGSDSDESFKISELAAQVAECEAEMGRLREAHASDEEAWAEEMDERDARIAELEEELAAAASRGGAGASSSSGSGPSPAAVAALEADLASALAQASVLQAQLSAERDAATSQLASLAASASESDAVLVAMTAARDELAAQVAAVGVERDEALGVAQDLDAKLEDMTQQALAERATAEQAASAVEELRKELEAARDELAAADAQAAGLNSAVGDLQAMLAERDSELAAAQADAARLAQELAAASAAGARGASSSAEQALRDENAALKLKLAAVLKDAAKWEAAFERTDADANTQRQLLEAKDLELQRRLPNMRFSSASVAEFDYPTTIKELREQAAAMEKAELALKSRVQALEKEATALKAAAEVEQASAIDKERRRAQEELGKLRATLDGRVAAAVASLDTSNAQLAQVTAQRDGLAAKVEALEKAAAAAPAGRLSEAFSVFHQADVSASASSASAPAEAAPAVKRGRGAKAGGGQKRSMSQSAATDELAAAAAPATSMAASRSTRPRTSAGSVIDMVSPEPPQPKRPASALEPASSSAAAAAASLTSPLGAADTNASSSRPATKDWTKEVRKGPAPFAGTVPAPHVHRSSPRKAAVPKQAARPPSKPQSITMDGYLASSSSSSSSSSAAAGAAAAGGRGAKSTGYSKEEPVIYDVDEEADGEKEQPRQALRGKAAAGAAPRAKAQAAPKRPGLRSTASKA